MSDVDRDLGDMMDPGQGYGRYDGGYDGSGMMDGGSMMDGSGWMIGFGVLTLVLLLLALAAVVTHLVLHATGRLAPASTASAATRTGTGAGAGTDARTVLDTRLARGEVSAEEYSSTRALLDA